MKVLFLISGWCMPRDVFLDDAYTSKRGLTGSETSILEYAKEFKRRGHDVGLWGKFAVADGMWDGIRVGGDVGNEKWDIAIAWIDPRPLNGIKAKLKVMNQQVNDFRYCPGWESYVDVITSPANNHREYLSQFTNFPTDNWLVWPNAQDPEMFKQVAGPRKNKRIIHASSPDRGLHWLLELFPRLRKEVPEAELHIFYSWKNLYETFKNSEIEVGCRIRYANEMMKRMKSHIHHHDSTSKLELVEYMQTSRVLGYPCDPVSYTEGFSVTTLEAAATGCVPVICGADSLQEIYGNDIVCSKAPYPKHKEEYYQNLKRMLTDDEAYVAAQKKAYNLSKQYTWKKVTDRFLKDLRPFIDKAGIHDEFFDKEEALRVFNESTYEIEPLESYPDDFEIELDSPSFSPDGLELFKASGYARKKRKGLTKEEARKLLDEGAKLQDALQPRIKAMQGVAK